MRLNTGSHQDSPKHSAAQPPRPARAQMGRVTPKAARIQAAPLRGSTISPRFKRGAKPPDKGGPYISKLRHQFSTFSGLS